MYVEMLRKYAVITVCIALFLGNLSLGDHGVRAAETKHLDNVTSGSIETYNFDNSRFFAPRNISIGEDIGNEGWLRITAKGRRDYLASINPRRCALVIVDMQNGMIGPNSWPEQLAKYNPEIAEYWNKRATETVIPTINRLTAFFREKDLPIVWLQLNPSGILPQLKTEFGPREFLVTKYSAGAFATSPIDNVLKELGVATVFFVGADTACCLFATVDGAYDRNYQTIVIEDGCLGSRPELHDAAIKIWAYRGFVRSSDQVINDYPWKKWIDPAVLEHGLQRRDERRGSINSSIDQGTSK